MCVNKQDLNKRDYSQKKRIIHNLFIKNVLLIKKKKRKHKIVFRFPTFPVST